MPHGVPSLVAYFSMEIGLESWMQTYSGGLGVLAGDTIRSAADLDVPMVTVLLIHRRGYFFQPLDTQCHSKRGACRVASRRFHGTERRAADFLSIENMRRLTAGRAPRRISTNGRRTSTGYYFVAPGWH